MIKFPWDKRGSIHLHQLPDKSPASLRQLSDEHLAEYMAGWRPGTADWINANTELQRRQSWPARWAIAISLVSLAVSIIALFLKR